MGVRPDFDRSALQSIVDPSRREIPLVKTALHPAGIGDQGDRDERRTLGVQIDLKIVEAQPLVAVISENGRDETSARRRDKL
jgi:hypothetical protein